MSESEKTNSDTAGNGTTAKSDDTDVPTAVAVSESTAPEFPSATVSEAAPGLLSASKMWWVTLVCLLLSIGLVWSSLPETGQQIIIHFPQGHGLKAGDAVRFRGIEVGQVTRVRLNGDVSGVTVSVNLKSGLGALDREGTRFWIVRPRLSLTEVSGLETAVGAKYIGVSPGDPAGAFRSDFEGLAAAPPDELDHGGLQVVLRSDDRHGTSPGAPVSWRGVTAGKVLSVNLSPDARHVHITIRIDRAFRKLVRPSSKFWVTSGFGVDIGLTGMKLNAQSLATILEGGISFATLAEGADNGEIRDGHVFALAESPEKEWLNGDATIPLIDFALPETVLVKGTRQSRVLGISRDTQFTQTGLLVRDRNRTLLLTAELPQVEDAEEFVAVELTSPGIGRIELPTTATTDCLQRAGVVGVPVRSASAVVRLQSLRRPTQAEDCLVVRSAVVDGVAIPVIQNIDLEEIAVQEEGWVVHSDSVDFSEWHGAPVMAMEDGVVIGILLTDSGSPLIALPAE
ncbi:MAG: MlaD family protein [Planctomycetaceae bacterium]|nr:MlaD family protein [Planctomycetaceae bacterium]